MIVRDASARIKKLVILNLHDSEEKKQKSCFMFWGITTTIKNLLTDSKQN